MLVHILAALVQGVTEWIPVSSEGAVSVVYSTVSNLPLNEAVRYALWLHLGTALAAVVVFWSQIVTVGRDLLSRPLRLSPLARYLVVATVVSGVVGLPLLVLLDEVSATVGGLALALVGVLMLVNGWVQWRQKRQGTRRQEHVTFVDGLVVGIAQGAAALPGLSRSGLTVAALLARGLDRKEALVLSFLMSIPAAVGAALYSGMRQGLVLSPVALVSVAVSFLVGLATLKVLLAVVEKVNFAFFIFAVGVSLIVAAAIQLAFF